MFRFLNETDEDLFLNLFSYSLLKLNADLELDSETNKLMNIDIQHLNWFIEFMSFLKVSNNNQKVRFT